MPHLVESVDWIGQWGVSWQAESDAAWAVTDATTGRLLGYAAVREISLMLGWAQNTYRVVTGAAGSGLSVRLTGDQGARHAGRVAFVREPPLHLDARLGGRPPLAPARW